MPSRFPALQLGGAIAVTVAVGLLVVDSGFRGAVAAALAGAGARSRRAGSGRAALGPLVRQGLATARIRSRRGERPVVVPPDVGVDAEDVSSVTS